MPVAFATCQHSHTHSKFVLAAAVCILKGAMMLCSQCESELSPRPRAGTKTTVISGHNTCSLIIAYCILEWEHALLLLLPLQGCPLLLGSSPRQPPGRGQGESEFKMVIS